MIGERRRMLNALVQLLLRRIRDDYDAWMGGAFLEDMGFDDCPICRANRLRNSLVG